MTSFNVDNVFRWKKYEKNKEKRHPFKRSNNAENTREGVALRGNYSKTRAAREVLKQYDIKWDPLYSSRTLITIHTDYIWEFVFYQYWWHQVKTL